MKRFLMRILLCVMIISISLSQITVFAAAGTYHLEDLGLSVKIPLDYSVITRDTPSNAAIFSELGISHSTLMDQFETSGIYLNAISDTLSEEIVITNMKNDLTNFGLLSDTVLSTFATTLINEYANRGVEVSKHDIYQHSQAKFIRVYWYDDATSAYGLQYYTIYDGNAMNFTIRSYDGVISSKEEVTIKNIVDSVKYDNAPPIDDEGENTDAFAYTDSDSGIKFTVPANWKQEEFTEDREYLDIKFVSTKEDGCTMIFGSTDVWAMTPAADKIGYTREDYNNSIFDTSDFAEMFNTTSDKVSTVTYNGVEYYKCETTSTREVYGLDVTLTMTQLLRVHNGWMYSFQFGGTSDHKLYPDFESLIKSVEYPTDINSGVAFDDDISYKTDTNDGYDGYSDDNSGAITAVVILIIAAVIVAVVLVLRKRKAKTTYETINNKTDCITPTVYCRKCGQALSLDSEFCHMCGTKIDKGV